VPNFSVLSVQEAGRKGKAKGLEGPDGKWQSEGSVSFGSSAGKKKSLDLGTIKFRVFFGRLVPEMDRVNGAFRRASIVGCQKVSVRLKFEISRILAVCSWYKLLFFGQFPRVSSGDKSF
jgi:hypothetical protein